MEDLTVEHHLEESHPGALSPAQGARSPAPMSPARKLRESVRRGSQDDVSPHSRRRQLERQQSQWVATEYESTYL